MKLNATERGANTPSKAGKWRHPGEWRFRSKTERYTNDNASRLLFKTQDKGEAEAFHQGKILTRSADGTGEKKTPKYKWRKW